MKFRRIKTSFSLTSRVEKGLKAERRRRRYAKTFSSAVFEHTTAVYREGGWEAKKKSLEGRNFISRAKRERGGGRKSLMEKVCSMKGGKEVRSISQLEFLPMAERGLPLSVHIMCTNTLCTAATAGGVGRTWKEAPHSSLQVREIYGAPLTRQPFLSPAPPFFRLLQSHLVSSSLALSATYMARSVVSPLRKMKGGPPTTDLKPRPRPVGERGGRREIGNSLP